MRRLLLSLLSLFLILNGFGQTMTELVVPKYFGSKSAASANNGRTPFAVCIKIDGLTPNQAYDVRAGIGLVSDAATSFGAGNIWVGGSFQASNLLNCFTTNASGSSGPFWIFFQPTGNGTRFDAGQNHNLRIGVVTNGGTMPSSPTFIGTKVMTALDIPTTARTGSTADDGAFVKGSASPSTTGKYVLLFDNVDGTGDPLFSYMIRQASPSETSYNSELPAAIKDIYSQSGTSAVGDYPAIIPIGANNPNGVRRIEARNADNTIYGFNTDSDGIWPSGGNTTTPVRREVVVITMGDAPLTPAATLPALTTAGITNITWNSATGGGDVTGDGGATVTARGICWATTPLPTLSGYFTSEPGTTGPFTSEMTGLNAQTTYYVRAYATNSAGTAYGNQVSFTTSCLPMAPIPDFSASNVNINVGDSISFFDNSMYCPTSWNWSFVGGMPYVSNDTNPKYIHYDFPGVYNVCLTVTNSYGTQTSCKMGYITVNAPPPPTNARIVITEIMYNPPESGPDSLEFIELYNNDTATVNLKDYYFSDGIQYTFPVYHLPPQSYLVICKDSLAMLHTFGIHSRQWTSGDLSNAGELILLRDYNGFTVDSVFYDDTYPWDSVPDGRGPSLELCDPSLDNSYAYTWRHALEFVTVNVMGDTIWASPGTGCSYPPVAAFSANITQIVQGGLVIFTDSTSGPVESWNWTFNGGSPGTWSGKTPPPVQYNSPGAYDVSLTVRNIAGKNTDVRSEYITVGALSAGNHPEPGIRIYPDPSAGIFTIQSDPKMPVRIRIYNQMGTLINQKTTQNGTAEFDLTGFPKGMYFAEIYDSVNGETVMRKLILQ